MKISVNKAQEVARYSNDVTQTNDVTQKINEVTTVMHENISHYKNFLNVSNTIFENLSNKINGEEDSQDLNLLIEIISKLCSQSIDNFRSILDLLEWSSDKTEKYVTEYQNLAERS